MPDTPGFIWLRARHARRGIAMLLVGVWAILWLSQGYTACCGPHVGKHSLPISPPVEIHAIVQSEYEGNNHSREPTCPQTFDERLTIASGQIGAVADGTLGQSVLQRQAPPVLYEPSAAGDDRTRDPPLPPGRVYLLLQRFLI